VVVSSSILIVLVIVIILITWHFKRKMREVKANAESVYEAVTGDTPTAITLSKNVSYGEHRVIKDHKKSLDGTEESEYETFT